MLSVNYRLDRGDAQNVHDLYSVNSDSIMRVMLNARASKREYFQINYRCVARILTGQLTKTIRPKKKTTTAGCVQPAAVVIRWIMLYLYNFKTKIVTFHWLWLWYVSSQSEIWCVPGYSQNTRKFTLFSHSNMVCSRSLTEHSQIYTILSFIYGVFQVTHRTLANLHFLVIQIWCVPGHSQNTRKFTLFCHPNMVCSRSLTEHSQIYTM